MRGGGGGRKVREGVSVTMVMRQKSGNDDIRAAMGRIYGWRWGKEGG